MYKRSSVGASNGNRPISSSGDFHESATFWKVSLSYIREGGRRGLALLEQSYWVVGAAPAVLWPDIDFVAADQRRKGFPPAKKGSTGFGFIARRWIPKKACRRFPPSRRVRLPTISQPARICPPSLFHFHLSLLLVIPNPRAIIKLNRGGIFTNFRQCILESSSIF